MAPARTERTNNQHIRRGDGARSAFQIRHVDVGVPRRRAEALVTEQRSDIRDAGAMLKQVRRERMTERMRMDALRDASAPRVP